jgi:hypothetical protein
MHDFEFTRLDGERECVTAEAIEVHDGDLHFYDDEDALVGIVPAGEWIDCVRVSDDEEDESEDGECLDDEAIEALDDVIEAVLVAASMLVIEDSDEDEDGDDDQDAE